ncbi:MAG: helix-turn-helix transcriptional regulator, partial [Burkholderiales bacterium]|nr:helix-turn-helix transcriptional regulator [Opitutaceae bacterium]
AAAHTLRRNLAQPPRVAELARHHGLTAGHFSTLFQAAHGLAPRAFLQRVRLDEARRRLRETDATVKEIADACGYVGAPHFCRAFKAATGLPPRAWRLAEGQGLPS